MSARQKGTLCVFLAAVLYSIGGLCIKLIPWSGIAINGARTAIALVVIGQVIEMPIVPIQQEKAACLAVPIRKDAAERLHPVPKQKP